MKGKQNDEREKISKGKSERVGEDIRGFNEMLGVEASRRRAAGKVKQSKASEGDPRIGG